MASTTNMILDIGEKNTVSIQEFLSNLTNLLFVLGLVFFPFFSFLLVLVITAIVPINRRVWHNYAVQERDLHKRLVTTHH